MGCGVCKVGGGGWLGGCARDYHPYLYGKERGERAAVQRTQDLSSTGDRRGLRCGGVLAEQFFSEQRSVEKDKKRGGSGSR